MLSIAMVRGAGRAVVWPMAAFTLSCFTLHAQNGWTQRVVGAPGARMDHAMAYDPVRQRTVLFGGLDFSYYSDTWEWDGTNWANRFPFPAPTARRDSAMAWDPIQSRVLLFGGAESSRLVADTWHWNGTTWTQLSGTQPAARYGHGLASDTTRGRVVLFGGAANTGVLGDTWEWDGTSWSQRFAASAPPPRSGFGIAYDQGRQRVVVFGGSNGTGVIGDTWEWDGTNWQQRFPATNPPARTGPVMTYDSFQGRVVVFGGWGGTAPLNDTWEYDGNDWLKVNTSATPTMRNDGGAAFDAARNTTVLFGGQNVGRLSDTWIYRAFGPREAVFPVANESTEGNVYLSIPFAVAQSRIQVLMEPDGYGRKRAGLVAAIEFRRDQGQQPFAARTIDVQLLVGFASTTAATMSTQFLSNWQGTPSLAFLSRLSLLAQTPVPTGPATFNVRLPFNTPIAWNGERLIYEITASNNTVTGIGTYELDAVAQLANPATVAPFGTACMGTTATPVYGYPNAQQVVPGGAIVSGLSSALPGALAFQFLGFSTTSWSGIPLPYVWPGTTCSIYTDIVVSQSQPVSAQGTAQVSWPLPSDPFWIGQVAFGQWAILEGPTVFPPIVLTDAVKLIVGGTYPAPYNAIANLDGSSIGNKQPGGFVTLVSRLIFN